MEHFLPEPNHPRVKWRTAATATLLLFAAYVAWQAVLGPMNGAEQEELGLGWKDYQAVSWGEGTSQEGAEFGVEEVQEIAYGDEAEQESGSVTSEQTTPSETAVSFATTQETSFPRMTSSKVARLLKDGTLSSYTWHASLENWTTSETSTVNESDSKEESETEWQSQNQGRLIVIGSLFPCLAVSYLTDRHSTGDVHGMNTSLNSLLTRLSYNSNNDTLLFVGDLVAKSTTDSTLSTVTLMRHIGAIGVRGNHEEGVIQWRRWMESYGPLGREVPSSSSAEPTSTGLRAHKGKQGWMGDTEDEEVQPRGLKTVARQGLKRVKRGWFGWGSGTTDEEQEEEAEADAEEELEEELEEGSDSNSDGAALTGTGARAESPSPTSFASFSLPVTPPSTNGSLTGPEWTWLDSDTGQLASLGVTVPRGWEWGGPWFEIARQMSAEDARWLERLPLTMWIEELRTYVVHAGMRESRRLHLCRW